MNCHEQLKLELLTQYFGGNNTSLEWSGTLLEHNRNNTQP